MSANSSKINASSLSSLTSSMGTGMMSGLKQSIGVILFTLLAVSMFIAAFVKMTSFVGSKDDWNSIQPQITKILILTMVGTFALLGAALLYYIQDPEKVIYFILVIVCLSLGLSFSALATAVISK